MKTNEINYIDLFKSAACALLLQVLLLPGFGYSQPSALEKQNPIHQIEFPEPGEECQSFIKGLPSDFRRGYLEVPLDYTEPNGRKIKVFYYTRLKPGSNRTPVVFFNGGPGGANRNYQSFIPIENRTNIDLIYMDQRGTGCSTQSPKVTDSKSALVVAHFSARNIVRDHEVLRKHLIGENQRWVIFGQSFGGWVVERYISMYPRSLLAAHNYGGASYPTEVERFTAGMLSSAKAFKKFYEVFPGSKEKMTKLRSMLTPDKCFQIREDESICGTAIISLSLLWEFYSEDTWFRINDLISNAVECKAAPCLFLESGDLNPEFWKAYSSHYGGLIEEFWGKTEKPVEIMVKIGQDQRYTQPRNPDIRIDIGRAKEIVKKRIGNLEEHIPFNYADVLTESVKNPKTRDRVAQLFKEITVKEPFSLDQLREGLLRNSKLKYYVYNGDFDGISNNPDYEKRKLPKNQVQYFRFKNTGHFGYQEEEVFWQNLTGVKNFKLFNESAMVILPNAEPIELRSVRRVGGSKSIDSLAADEAINEVVYVGLGNESYATELKEKVSGKFALIDRGGAFFYEKAKHAVDAGAKGIIFVNMATFPDSAFVVDISEAPVAVPGIMVSRSEGDLIKNLIQTKSPFKLKLLWVL